MSREETTHVVCINNTDYPSSLEFGKVYRVLPDDDATEDEMVRVIDESGEDYLYPGSYFLPIDLPQEIERALAKAS